MDDMKTIEIKLTLESGKQLECELIASKKIDNLTYVALEDKNSKNIYLYELIRKNADFELKTIDDKTYENIKNIFDGILFDDEFIDKESKSHPYPKDKDCTPSQFLDKYGFKFMEKRLLPHLLKSITLTTDKRLKKFAKSKVGGYPDTPKSFKWPKRNDKPLDFLVQFNFKDLKAYDDNKLLPDNGFLYIFINHDQLPSYSEGQAHECIYSEQTDNLSTNKEKKAKYSEVAFRYHKTYSLPDYNEIESLFSEDLYYEYDEMSNNIHGHTWLLGHPYIIQDDPIKTIHQYNQDDKDDWILLFQLESLYDINMNWIDDGYLYFYIKKKDLLKKDFSKVIMIMNFS